MKSGGKLFPCFRWPKDLGQILSNRFTSNATSDNSDTLANCDNLGPVSSSVELSQMTQFGLSNLIRSQT